MKKDQSAWARFKTQNFHFLISKLNFLDDDFALKSEVTKWEWSFIRKILQTQVTTKFSKIFAVRSFMVTKTKFYKINVLQWEWRLKLSLYKHLLELVFCCTLNKKYAVDIRVIKDTQRDGTTGLVPLARVFNGCVFRMHIQCVWRVLLEYTLDKTF